SAGPFNRPLGLKFILAGAIISLVGCAGPSRVAEQSSAQQRVPATSMSVTGKGTLASDGTKSVEKILPAPTGVDYFGTSRELERLSSLWASRTGARPFADFPIGPGDQIDLSVPGVDELTDTVRVSATGTIHLAYIGEIQAAGLTENELRSEIENRLRIYMH